jgi:putative spermidine/putrescine transport system ATP-binding protein
MSAIELRALSKRYGRHAALGGAGGIDLDVADGELVAILGPSGAGKTTALTLVAGFEEPTSGAVVIGGRDVTRLPAHRRDVGVVFQSYALFPHLTVGENVAFPLRSRGVPRAQRRERVAQALATVGLPGTEERAPGTLSGGQQQRVALARAIVFEPRILLLDEPLAALDRRLRDRMQVELRALHRELGVTLLLVTHDQEEALTLSDRLVVLHDGEIAQQGPPAEVYRRPASRFVAEFLGASNLLARDGGVLLVRPEDVRLHAAEAAPADGACLPARVLDTVFLGSRVLCHLRLEGRGDADGALLLAERPASEPVLAAGERVTASWDPARAAFLTDHDSKGAR